MSLRAKLVLWYTGVFGLSGCVLVVALYSLIAHRLQSEVDRYLENEYDEWVHLTLEHLKDPDRLEETIRQEIQDERIFPFTYRLHDTARGRDVLRLGDPSYRGALAAAAPIDRLRRRRLWASVRLPDRHPYRVLTGPLDPQSQPRLALQVSIYTERLAERMASLRKYLALVLSALVVVAAAGGWFLAARSLRPIDQLVTELSQIESRSLNERLDVGHAGDEVDRLREAINRMLERLDRAFEGLRSFTADAAHELRTPLSAVRCRLEVALNKRRSPQDEQVALGEVLEQVAELSALVENLLLLARMDAEEELPSRAAVEVDHLLHQVCEPFGLLAEEKGLTLTVEADEPGQVEGDPVLLRRLFGNLIDNAIRHTPPGGRVTLHAARSGDACRVSVADTGAGIEPEALEHIFDRFYRADESRSRAEGGTGLGLSIAKRVVELHRGTIDIDSTPAQGTVVHVSLPSAPSSNLSDL